MVYSYNILGIIFGILISISAILWFGYQHYQTTKEDRLPFRVKEGLAKIQKQLPIRLNQDVILESFKLKTHSMDLVLRNTSAIEERIPKDTIALQMNYLVCKFRDKVLNDTPFIVNFKLLNFAGDIIATVNNTPKTCLNIPKEIQKNIEL